jgi:type I restriction enzyme S subunit
MRRPPLSPAKQPAAQRQPAGHATTPSELRPRLRFPEFRKAGEWEAKRLSSVIELISGMHLSPEQYDSVGEVPYFTGPSDFTNELPSVTKWTKLSANVSQHEDTLITVKGSGVGEVWYSTLPAVALGRQLMAVRVKHGSSLFIFQLLLTKKTRFEDLGAGNLIPGLSRTDILEMEAHFPPLLPEQHHIAACLSSLDDLLAAERQKLDALKAHKQGLMQQLFPRAGETVPRLRFPEFRKAGEWEETSIGQLGEVVTGSTPSTARPEYYGGDRMFVSPADISDGRFIEKTKTTLTALGFEETRPIKANSILFVCIGSTIGKIAQNRHECATNQQINSVVPNSTNAHGFIYYALSGKADEIANLAGIQAVPIVNKSLFSSVELLVPKLLEQHRIASCLSSLDDLIAAQSDKVEALKTHKKGLMQQLFPAPAEGEG